MKTILPVFCGIAFISTIFGYDHIQIGGLFPFGPVNGDDVLPPGDDFFIQFFFALVTNFQYNGTQYTNTYIGNNGLLSFIEGISIFTPSCGPGPVPMIAPFWSDIDTRVDENGKVYYRETQNSTDLMQASAEIYKKFPYYMKIRWAFIVTWNNTAFYGSSSCNATSIRNTFQCILATDGTHYFAIFKYGDMEWTTGTASGGNCTGRGGSPAQVGFDLGNNTQFLPLPSSCTDDVSNINQTSNVKSPGTWVFQINDGVMGL